MESRLDIGTDRAADETQPLVDAVVPSASLVRRAFGCCSLAHSKLRTTLREYSHDALIVLVIAVVVVLLVAETCARLASVSKQLIRRSALAGEGPSAAALYYYGD